MLGQLYSRAGRHLPSIWLLVVSPTGCATLRLCPSLTLIVWSCVSWTATESRPAGPFTVCLPYWSSYRSRSKQLSLQLRKLDRNREPPEDGPMCEMLWNDPMEGRGMVPNKVGALFRRPQ